MLLAWAVCSQILFFLGVVPTAAGIWRYFDDLGLRHAGSVAAMVRVAAWRGPLWGVLLAGQGICVTLAARRRQYGLWLLVVGAGACLVTVALVVFGYFLVGIPVVQILSDLPSGPGGQ